MRKALLLAGLLMANNSIGDTSSLTASATLASPLVIAHRGASGHRPEHTLEAYRLAIDMGADFIEPDLVATRDGQLVARHEPDISATTDVATRAEFADRQRSVRIDGVEYRGWFTTDFTLAELKTLRAIEPRADRSKAFDGLYEIPTLEEIIALAQRESVRLGRTIGIYPETKHPHWHCTQGLALEPPLLAALERAGWNTRAAPVFIQSFESGNLRWLRERTPLRLVQLLGGEGLTTDGKAIPAKPWTNDGACERYPVGELPRDFDDPRSFAQMAEYAAAVGPWKRFLIGERQSDDGSARATTPTRFVELAHAAGLAVHPWTFRNEPVHLLADHAGDPLKEYRAFAALGVDAVFTDYPDTALRAFGRADDQPRN